LTIITFEQGDLFQRQYFKGYYHELNSRRLGYGNRNINSWRSGLFFADWQSLFADLSGVGMSRAKDPEEMAICKQESKRMNTAITV